MEEGAGQLSDSIMASQEALGHGYDIVNNTSKSFEQITEAAEGASSVQSDISDVIIDSQGKLQLLCQFFDKIKYQYQEVVKHIDRASSLGTTKSTMFEDMNNMLSQIEPMMKDTDA